MSRGIGGEQVEGRQAVATLLSAGRRRVHDVWMADGQDPAPILERIRADAGHAGVRVIEVNRARLAAEARTEAPQGVLAHADPLPEVDLEELLAVTKPVAGGLHAPPVPFLLAFDGVTDPHNVGALLRSAEAAGATGAVFPQRRAVHVTPAVAKAAAGAIEHLALARAPGMPSAVSKARDLGCWVVGLDAGAGQSLYDDLPLATEPVMMVVGAEGAGLSELVRRRCDVLVRIPMAGATESLNVSVAGALALFEIACRRARSAR